MKKTARNKRPAVSTLTAKKKHPHGEIVSQSGDFTTYEDGWISAPQKKPVAGNVARKTRQPARAKDSRMEVVPPWPEFSLWEEIQVVPADPAGYAAFCQRTGRTPKPSATRERRAKVLRVESSPEVERALVLALMGINNAPGARERARMRLGLWNLMLLAGGRCPFGDDWEDFRDRLLDDLSETIGKTLLAALDEGTPKRVDATAKKAGRALARAVADVETAAASLARYRTKLPLPGDKSPGAWTWMLQHTAKEIFRETRQRPTKTEIRQRLKAEGWDFPRSNDPVENWRRVFRTAGLENLPS